MWTKNMAKRLAVLILTGTLLVVSGCQDARTTSLAGGFDDEDPAHPRHATGVESHVADY